MTNPTDKPSENARPMTAEEFGAWINAAGGPLVIDETRLVKTLAKATPRYSDDFADSPDYGPRPPLRPMRTR